MGEKNSDHKHLIELINRVQSCYGAAERGVLAAAIADLAKFLNIHFATEEKIVRAACGDPLAQQVYESHLALTMKMNQLQKDSSGALRDATIEQIREFVGDLIVYIVKVDLKMRPALSQYSPTFVPR